MRVHLNSAMSLDGRVAGPGGAHVGLSDEADWARVHRLRAISDAVLVGVGTVLLDDPRLTARPDPPPQRQPLRVVLDRRARTPPEARVCDGEASTVIYTEGPAGKRGSAELVPLGSLTIERVVDDLAGRGVRTLLVEGGPTVLRSFLAAGAWDAWTIFVTPRVLGSGPGILHDPTPPLGGSLRAAPLGEGFLLTIER